MESFNHFPSITKALHTALSRAVKKCAFDIQGQAQKRAAVDTGFLRNSIYVVTSENSTYGQGAEPTKKGASLLPEVGKPGDDLTAYVAVGASYGIYVNYGTHSMAAQPFWEPAIEAVKPGFEQALSKIEDKIKGSVH